MHTVCYRRFAAARLSGNARLADAAEHIPQRAPAFVGGNAMDVFQFPSVDRPNNQVQTKAVCTECGVALETRHNRGGGEMICDACYSAQFEPVRIHHWQRIPHRLRRAR